MRPWAKSLWAVGLVLLTAGVLVRLGAPGLCLLLKLDPRGIQDNGFLGDAGMRVDGFELVRGLGDRWNGVPGMVQIAPKLAGGIGKAAFNAGAVAIGQGAID